LNDYLHPQIDNDGSGDEGEIRQEEHEEIDSLKELHAYRQHHSHFLLAYRGKSTAEEDNLRKVSP